MIGGRSGWFGESWRHSLARRGVRTYNRHRDDDDYGSIAGTLSRKDRIPGGMADKKSVKDFDQKALRKGVKVELEHTSDPLIAREIAMDHLTEDPLYYEKLAQIESGAGSIGRVNGVDITAEKIEPDQVYPISPLDVKEVLRDVGKDSKGIKRVAFVKPKTREQAGAWAQYVRGKREVRVFAQPKVEVGPYAKDVRRMVKNDVLRHEIGHHVALSKRRITDRDLRVAEARADAYSKGFDVEDRGVKRFVR